MRRTRFIVIAVFVASISILCTPANAQLQRVHYFFNSGWLVETSRHFLVFDFIPSKESGISFSTLQEEMQPNPENKPVIMFVSHDHPDHFSDSIFHWQPLRNNRKLILGWKPAKLPAVKNLSVLNPGDSLSENNLSVYTHPATDDGSAFLVTIDGITIYHAGDHALWVEELAAAYTAPMYTIREKASQIDLAFLPAAKGMATQCAVDSVMKKSVKVAIDILRPKKAALQHIGCAEKLPMYRQLSEKLSALKVEWLLPEKFNSRLR